MKQILLIATVILSQVAASRVFAAAEYRIPKLPSHVSLADSVKLTTKEKLSEDTLVIQGSIEVIVPKGWGVKGGPQDSGLGRDLLELYPEGVKIPGIKSALFGHDWPVNVMHVYRVDEAKYRPLPELLQWYKDSADKKPAGRKVVDLALKQIGGREWLVQIYDGDVMETKPVQVWQGFTNVGKTPYRVRISYLPAEKENLGRQMIELVAKLGLK